MTDKRREVLEKLWNTCIAHQNKWGNYKFDSAKGQHAKHHKRKVIDQALADIGWDYEGDITKIDPKWKEINKAGGE